MKGRREGGGGKRGWGRRRGRGEGVRVQRGEERRREGETPTKPDVERYDGGESEGREERARIGCQDAKGEEGTEGGRDTD